MRRCIFEFHILTIRLAKQARSFALRSILLAIATDVRTLNDRCFQSINRLLIPLNERIELFTEAPFRAIYSSETGIESRKREFWIIVSSRYTNRQLTSNAGILARAYLVPKLSSLTYNSLTELGATHEPPNTAKSHSRWYAQRPTCPATTSSDGAQRPARPATASRSLKSIWEGTEHSAYVPLATLCNRIAFRSRIRNYTTDKCLTRRERVAYRARAPSDSVSQRTRLAAARGASQSRSSSLSSRRREGYSAVSAFVE